jgi:hypothetical protein
MSSDLLAEFDSFYRAPQDAKSIPTTSSNDLSFLSGNTGTGQPTQQSGQQQPGYSQWQGAQRSNGDIWGGMNAFQPAANTQPSAPPQNDIWGSLGNLQQKSQPPAQGLTATGSGNGGFALNNARINTPSRNTGTTQGQTQDLFSSFAPVGQPAAASGTGPGQFSIPKQHTPMSVPSGDVLFDAVEEQSAPVDDDDEFGEFESVTPEPSFQSAPPPPQPTQSLDLFETEPHRPGPTQKQTSASFAPANYNHGILSFAPVQKPDSFQQPSPFASASSTQQATQTKQDAKTKPASSVAVWPDLEPKVSKPNNSQALSIPGEQVDDEWGEFSPETPAVTSAKGVSGLTSDSWAWDSAGSPAAASPQVNVPPPTNIPPPSVFLTLFPTLFDLPQSKLFAPVSGQTFSLKNRILSDPSTIEFVRGYLLIATVAGRVLAGRKLRWKRDTILAQSMRVGPSAAGGKGGMKLAGLDRAEITREDRDAAEVARIWKEQLGRLRSAVAVSNSSTQDSSRQLAIPDVSENIHVKTQPGAVTAPRPCIICGLKRDERANKVDVDVEDSFGEWWVDHWGHRSCRNFWLEHESKLRSR